MFIRYFARTDDSPIGQTAKAYCDALVGTGIPVRLVSTRIAELQTDHGGRSSSIWDEHRRLLTTSMKGAYVNVVCGDVADWPRYYTAGVTNALLIVDQNLEPSTQPTAQSSTDAATYALRVSYLGRYEVIYASTKLGAGLVERVAAITPTVVPLGTDAASAAFSRLQVF